MRLPPLLALGLALPFVPTTASAQTFCFAPTTASAPTTHVTAALTDRFRSQADCRYGVRTVGGTVLREGVTLPEGERDLPTLLRDVGLPPARRDLAADLEVFAFPPASGRDSPPAQTVALRPCLAHLGEGTTAVRFERTSTGELRLTAPRLSACPVEGVELLVVDGADAPTLLTATAGARLLTLGEAQSVDVPRSVAAAGIYLRRHGGDLALRVDSMRFGDPQTPLQRLFAESATRWFDTDWRRGELRLTPRADLFARDPMRWSELVTAAAASALVVTAAPDRDGSAATFSARVDADGSALTVPDEAVRSVMRRRYGAPGGAMAPGRRDWADVLGSLRLCHAGRYTAAPTRNARATPAELASLRCVALAQVAPLTVTGIPEAFTLERHLDVFTRTGDGVGVSQASAGEAERVPLEAESPVRLATVGDRVLAPDALPQGSRMVLCPTSAEQGPREGVALDARGAHAFDDRAAGLWQVVMRPADDPRCAPQDLALARIAVLRPRDAWLPVGLVDHGSMSLSDPWSTVPGAGDDTFAFTARAGLPEWRLATTPDVTAAINAYSATTSDPSVAADDSARINRVIPTRLRVEPELHAPGRSALVVLLSDRDVCPRSPDDLLENLRALPSEGSVHAFLATERAADSQGARFTCLARARLRSTPPLIHRSADAGPFYFRWGLPGSVELRAQYELHSQCSRGDCVSIGVAAPLLYARVSPRARVVSWLTLDVSIPVMVLASPGDGRALHTGTGLDVTLSGGPFAIPRMVSFGVLIQPTVFGVAPAASDSAVNIALHLGVNLGSLFDYLRGL
jgi:hypothetical protein